MSVRPGLYQMEQLLAERFPQLRPAQQRGLAYWVVGTIIAGSACETAVLSALSLRLSWHALRLRLRDWLYDGQDKAAPCRVELDIAACFVPLLRWILAWWHESRLVLAIDATLDRDRSAALVISVLYRGTAIPVAWSILRAQTPGAWFPAILRMLAQLQPAVPAQLPVLVLADRGLWSPKLWDALIAQHWHPLLRIQDSMTVAPAGRERTIARRLVQSGSGWVGKARLGTDKKRRLRVTLIVVQTIEQREPWVLVTDLPPERVGVSWYVLRMWVELGFRALKSMGWQWERTRRTDTVRIERYWLILAVATLWVVAVGTRVEDAEGVKRRPEHLRRAPDVLPPAVRLVSLFTRGVQISRQLLAGGRLWTRLWFGRFLLPEPPANVSITIHCDSS